MKIEEMEYQYLPPTRPEPNWPAMFRRAGKTGPVYSAWRLWVMERHPDLEIPTWEELKASESHE